MAVQQNKSLVDAYLQSGIYYEKDGRIFDRFNNKEIIPILSAKTSTNNDNGNGNKTKTNTNDISGSREEFLANEGDKLNKFQIDYFNRNGFFRGSAQDIAARAKKERLNQQNLQRLGRYAQKRRGGVLRYPLEALTEQTDYLQIDIEKYEPIGSSYASAPGDSNRYVKGNILSNRAGRRGANKLSTKPLINAGTILLPIPANLSDTNNVQYDSSTLNGLAAAGVQAAEGIMTTDFTQGFNQGLKQLNQVRQDVAANIKDGVNEAGATNVITKALAAEAVNIFGANVTVNQLLARGNGEILNPNMELLFGGPTLRNFRFQFKFTPRNPKESEQVKLIIRAFKRNMAPQAQGGDLGSGNWFLKTPNVFKLRYRTGRRDHPFLNRFKQCFLSDMQTTYTGDGVYMTYDDATPVSIILDLSFKEIQPIYDIDYDERPGDSAVGY
tara:strand:- start:984 stop:2303 length:1320 start_codon:yes stop_codon:yes gene_type:complete